MTKIQRVQRSKGRAQKLAATFVATLLSLGGGDVHGEDQKDVAPGDRLAESASKATSRAEVGEASALGTTEIDRLEADSESMAVTSWLAQEALARGQADDPVFAARLRLLEEKRWVAAFQMVEANLVEVSEAELDALEAEYPLAFQKPRRWRLRNLFLRSSLDSTAAEREELRARLEEIREAVVAGADFAQLAADYSQSETRYRGGLLGVVEPGELPPAVEARIESLKEGNVSEVIASTQGFMLFYCDAILPAESPSRDEVRRNFRSNLTKQKMGERWAAINQTVEERADPSFFVERLEAPDAVLVSGLGLEVDSVDLDAALALRPAAAAKTPSPAALRALLETIATTRLLAQEARRRGVELSVEDRRALEVERLEALARSELARRIDARLEPVTEVATRQYFDDHRQDFTVRRQLELSALRLDFDGAGDADLLKAGREAADLAERIQRDPSLFADLARAHSSLPSAAAGGYLGWLPLRRVFAFGPSVSRAVEALESGESTSPVREGDSFWIVLLHAERPRRPMTFEEARPLAEERLGQEWVNALRAEIEAEVLEQLKSGVHAVRE